jgi:hypothetical protein
MNDIQEIGLMIMLLPPLAMLPILGFGLWQLIAARRTARLARLRLRVD